MRAFAPILAALSLFSITVEAQTSWRPRLERLPFAPTIVVNREPELCGAMHAYILDNFIRRGDARTDISSVFPEATGSYSSTYPLPNSLRLRPRTLASNLETSDRSPNDLDAYSLFEVDVDLYGLGTLQTVYSYWLLENNGTQNQYVRIISGASAADQGPEDTINDRHSTFSDDPPMTAHALPRDINSESDDFAYLANPVAIGQFRDRGFFYGHDIAQTRSAVVRIDSRGQISVSCIFAIWPWNRQDAPLYPSEYGALRRSLRSIIGNYQPPSSLWGPQRLNERLRTWENFEAITQIAPWGLLHHLEQTPSQVPRRRYFENSAQTEPGIWSWAYLSPWNFRTSANLVRQTHSFQRALADYFERRFGSPRGPAEVMAFASLVPYLGTMDVDVALPTPPRIASDQDTVRRWMTMRLEGNTYPITTWDRDAPLGAREITVSDLEILRRGLMLGLSGDLVIQFSRRVRPLSDEEGSILTYALSNPDMVWWLLRREGADPNHRDWFRKTPLMFATHFNEIASTRVLLRNGADVNAVTLPQYEAHSDDPANTRSISNGNRTALMYAAENASPELILLLLDHGADPTMRSTNGDTVMEFLARNTRLNDGQRAALQREIARRQVRRTRPSSR